MKLEKEEIDRIEQIRSKSPTGTIDPQDVVNDARDPASPLHARFDGFDDVKAANAHYLSIARDIIRSVEIRVSVNRTVIESVAYVRSPYVPKQERGYVAVTALRADQQAARRVMLRECKAALAIINRTRNLAAVLGLSDLVEEALQDMIKIEEKLSV